MADGREEFFLLYKGIPAHDFPSQPGGHHHFQLAQPPRGKLGHKLGFEVLGVGRGELFGHENSDNCMINF